MRIDVLLVNGEVDEWDDAKAEMDGNLPGSMVIVDADDKPVCIYAPGMWIKIEFDVEDESV